MNIKRRLFLSNILMVVIPLVVSLAVFFGGLHFYALVAGMNDEQPDGTRSRGLSFMEALDETRELAEEWPGSQPGAIIEDVKSFNDKYADGRLFLTVYKEGVPITGEAPKREIETVDAITGQALDTQEPVIISSRSLVHAQTTGDYRVVLSDVSRFARTPRNYKDIMRKGAVVSLLCSVIIILITNRFLTRFVFKRIVHGMDAVTNGVHQVRDGNLSFRIDYRENDEFSQVCGDFNEMAGRLLESVEARRKDERSRKELLAGISHDLRTPLTSIKAYVEGLEKGVASTNEAKSRYVDTIKNKTVDLEHIIDSLFLFSKLDTGEFPYNIERVDMVAAVAEIVDSLSEEYRSRGLDIFMARAGYSEERLFADIDVVQMRYMMINLFENSVKYKNKPRGKITVEVAGEGGSVSIAASDDGPGVPEEALSKLFDVFYRGDVSRSDPGKGSGLGLAIVAKMAARFEGSISAANVPGGGLSIKMAFPSA